MLRGSRRLLWAVAAGVAGEVLIATTLRVAVVDDGRTDWRDAVAEAGLGWLAVLAGLVVLLGFRYRHADVSLLDQTEALTSTAVISHEWMWQSSPELTATYCNPALSEILGYEPDEMLGRSFFDFIYHVDRPRARAILSHAVTSGQGWTDVELRWRHRDGHLVRLQGSAVPVLDRQGRLVGFRGSRRNVPDAAATVDRAGTRTRSLDRLMSRRNLKVAMQPVVELGTGRCVGVEALARFPDGRPPDIWFAEAHAVGRGIDLELFAIEVAIAQLPHLPDGLRLSVNASPATMLDPRFSPRLQGVPLHRITLEITEHAVVDLYDELHGVLLPLRQAGLHVAVDDTGAGYSSFSHVLQLRPDTIKLDQSWLRGIETDRARRTLVTAAVLLALDLGATLTAEGVETREQLDALCDLGVEHAQGYLLARPDLDRRRWASWASASWSDLTAQRKGG